MPNNHTRAPKRHLAFKRRSTTLFDEIEWITLVEARARHPHLTNDDIRTAVASGAVPGKRMGRTGRRVDAGALAAYLVANDGDDK